MIKKPSRYEIFPESTCSCRLLFCCSKTFDVIAHFKIRSRRGRTCVCGHKSTGPERTWCANPNVFIVIGQEIICFALPVAVCHLNPGRRERRTCGSSVPTISANTSQPRTSPYRISSPTQFSDYSEDEYQAGKPHGIISILVGNSTFRPGRDEPDSSMEFPGRAA